MRPPLSPWTEESLNLWVKPLPRPSTDSAFGGQVRETDDVSQRLIAGLKLAISANKHTESLRYWLSLAEAPAPFAGANFKAFHKQVGDRLKLRILSIDTTGACDLRCPSMCYYNPDISLERGIVEESALRRAIVESVKDLDLRLLMFMGKEPLLNPKRLFSLLSFAGPTEERSFRTGMVSNGRNLKKQSNGLAEALEKTWLDFIDVSIDSADSAVHDLIRGLPGSWQMTMEGVRWLTGQWNEYPLSIVSTLRRDNYQSILPLIDLCSSFCRSYQIQPIQPPPYVVTRPLSVPFVTAFFENLLKALDGPLAGRGLRVGFELYGYYLYAFLQAGLIQASAIREDDEGQLHIALQMNGNTVMVQLEILPLQAWRLDRILYDGSYLGHMHFLQAADPYSMSVGRIQDESIVSLYSKSIAYGSHFHQIVESRSQHECKSRSCWSGCFGGWNGAENAFVNANSLCSQPLLCTKGRESLYTEHDLKAGE